MAGNTQEKYIKNKTLSQVVKKKKRLSFLVRPDSRKR
jgi:hypothetical protein